LVGAEEQPDETVLAVHDAPLVEYLATAWEEWEASGLTEDPGQDRVVPYLFPLPGLFPEAVPPAKRRAGGLLAASKAAHPRGADARVPSAVSARAGRFAYDTMTLIGPGTWEAVRAALDTAVKAADLALGGAPAAYALCRPPGHHATRACFGGSCYLNNTAAAAARLHEGTGHGTVAILDVDAHHGNGTQAIFWNEPEFLTGSVHVDPGAGWFPHYIGFADETSGVNCNIPVPPGTGDESWIRAVADLADWAADADVLVVALGVDAAGGDPESPLEVTPDGFRRAGRILGGMGLPTVVVQEGGYDLDRIGDLVLEVLAGIEEGAHG
jgi:acetoin utilization deacetylase AcuC-like enzyme